MLTDGLQLYSVIQYESVIFQYLQYHLFLIGWVRVHTILLIQHCCLSFIKSFIKHLNQQYKMSFLNFWGRKEKLKPKYLTVCYFWLLIKPFSLFYITLVIAWVGNIFNSVFSSIWIRTLSITVWGKIVNLEWCYSLFEVCPLPKAKFDLCFEVILLLSFLTFSGNTVSVKLVKISTYHFNAFSQWECLHEDMVSMRSFKQNQKDLSLRASAWVSQRHF